MKTIFFILMMLGGLVGNLGYAQTVTHREDFTNGKANKPSRQTHTKASLQSKDTILIPAIGRDSALTIAEFRAKAVQKVKKFTSYLSIITDSLRTIPEKDTAITQACSLFINDRAHIVFSSKTSNKNDSMGVRTYLTNLMLHRHYKKVEFSFRDVAFAGSSEIKKSPDGNYYGSVRFVQEFKGTAYITKRNYHDLTKKLARATSRNVIKINERGVKEGSWDILLVRIEVLETELL